MEEFVNKTGRQPEPYIRSDKLTFTYYQDAEDAPYDAQIAVNDVSVSINKGELVAVIGRNGSGKSTFAKMLNLILEPTSGELYVAGKKVSQDMSDEDVLDLRRRVGMVFQNPDNQLVATVVEEDVAFGPENVGVPPEEIRKRVDEALGEMSLGEFADREPARLSGGQKQRVAIAGILALSPECIIFDESTAMLDPIGRKDVLGIMKRLSRENGITVINITHLMDEAAAADRIIVLNRGRYLDSGTPKDIFSDSELMDEAGIQLPQCSGLCRELKKRGIDIGFGITPEETCRLITDALEGLK